MEILLCNILMKIIMRIYKIFFLINLFIQLLCNSVFATNISNLNNVSKVIDINQCANIADKSTLSVLWENAEPYACKRINSIGQNIVTCLDVELINELSRKTNITVNYTELDWNKTLEEIKFGKSDMTFAATYTEERAKYAIFSIAYRYEQISLFAPYNSFKKLKFQNIKEFFTQIRLQNFRLGIISGYVYGDDNMMNFLYNEVNKDIIIQYNNNADVLSALLRGEIDGFISDRVLGLANTLNNNISKIIEEIPLGISMPVHILFSKKTVSPEVINCFNKAIERFIGSDEYKKMLQIYIYHVLLPKVLNSHWYYVIGIIGGFAFIISGMASAAKEKATLFGTFILSVIPAFPAVIILDTIASVNSITKEFVITPTYIYSSFIIVLIGFFTIKVLDYYHKQLYQDIFIINIWQNFIVICDALGQAIFTAIGVIAAIVHKFEPLWFWGPTIAFFIVNSGSLLREILCRHTDQFSIISGHIHAEISIFWSSILVILLNIYAYNPSYNVIQYSVISVITGSFLTKLAVYYFKISNIRLNLDNNNL